ncbi:MAG: MaoC family dehydratase N-terminal domain-containing protein [Sphingomonas sp.]
MSDDFSDWVGRVEEAADTLEPARCNALRVALGDAAPLEPGAPLPLLHHWLYFWDVRPPSGLGADGHPARGGFLPPVPLPRRMWAGGRLRFLAPLILGERVTRTSTILKVEAKSGRSGDLVFVTVEHVIAGARGPAVIEQQDIVYKGASPSGSIAGAGADVEPADAVWREDVFPDPVLLLRYSGLTMNGHRIHYDRPYAMDEEAYPALVVHGPLQATLLARLAASALAAPIATFDFRGEQPAFDGTMLHVCGRPTEAGPSLWTEQGGRRNMIATATCGTPA